jgi:hypothetical protein
MSSNPDPFRHIPPIKPLQNEPDKVLNLGYRRYAEYGLLHLTTGWKYTIPVNVV